MDKPKNNETLNKNKKFPGSWIILRKIRAEISWDLSTLVGFLVKVSYKILWDWSPSVSVG